MTKHPATMNALCHFTVIGRTAIIQGQTRTIVSCRLCYGASISLELDCPLEGCSSPLFTVEPSNLHEVFLVS
jgi:hypothetical protein